MSSRPSSGNDADNWRIAAIRSKDAPAAAAAALGLHTRRPTTRIHTGKVLIVGAGWYGCHAAVTLTKLGVPFDIVDSTGTVMSESSTKNQNRLHLGFHYPRAYHTRHECVLGYQKFMADYAHVTVGVPKNLYLVAKGSLIDYQTYCNIFAYEGTNFKNVTTSEQAGMPFPWIDDEYDGLMLTEERMIDCVATRAHFNKVLAGRLVPGYRPADLSISSAGVFCGDAQYSLALDCTYGQLDSDPNALFELSCSWVYRFKGDLPHLFGFTVMDGPFFSIFPFKPADRLFTLTHVAYTPLMTSPDIADIRGAMANPDTAAIVEAHRARAVAHVQESIPEFDRYFEYESHFLSIKCKSRQRDDDRSLRVRETSNCVSFCGGKITGIFAMQRHLETMAAAGAFARKAVAERASPRVEGRLDAKVKLSPRVMMDSVDSLAGGPVF